LPAARRFTETGRPVTKWEMLRQATSPRAEGRSKVSELWEAEESAQNKTARGSLGAQRRVNREKAEKTQPR